MKTSIKRLICAVFCLCLILATFSACGGGSETASSEPSSDGGNSGNDIVLNEIESDVDPYANIPAEIKGQTVRIATWENLDSYDFSAFEADTGIKAEIFLVPQEGYVNAITVKIAAGDIPDVFVDNDGTGFPTTLEIAQPINKCSQVDLTDPIWDQSLIATATIDGNIYLVNALNSPWNGANLIYFNKALFDELGEKTPDEYYKDGEWTWNTLEDMLKRFHAAGYYGANINPRMLAGSAGASFVTYDYKNARFFNNVDSVELLSAYETYADWNHMSLLGGTQQAFKEGKCAIYALGVYGLKTEGHWKDMDPEDLGFTYFPAAKDGGTAYVHAIYRMYGIVDGAPHANAAGYFLRHFLDYKNYDLNDTFISTEAGNFYYEITSVTADKKYFDFDDHCGSLIGLPGYTFSNPVSRASKNDVPTEIQAVDNQVEKAVEAGNKMIEKVKNKFK